MVARARDSVRQARKAELLEAREEFLLMLPAEQAEHPLAHHFRPLGGGYHQLKAEQILMVDIGLRLDRRL